MLQDEGVCTLEDITGPEREYRDYVQKQYDIIDTEHPKVAYMSKFQILKFTIS